MLGQLRSRRLWAATARGLAACLVFAFAGRRWLYVSWQIRSAQKQLCLAETKEVHAALKALKAAEGVERPDRAELLYLLGRAHRRAGNLEEAFACLREAEQ